MEEDISPEALSSYENNEVENVNDVKKPDNSITSQSIDVNKSDNDLTLESSEFTDNTRNMLHKLGVSSISSIKMTEKLKEKISNDNNDDNINDNEIISQSVDFVANDGIKFGEITPFTGTSHEKQFERVKKRPKILKITEVKEVSFNNTKIKQNNNNSIKRIKKSKQRKLSSSSSTTTATTKYQ